MTTLVRVVLAGAIGVVLLGGVTALRSADDPSTLDEAISQLQDNKRFATSGRAGQTVADISAALRTDGAACRDDDGDDDARCSALLSASAFSAVTAFTMLDCTAPGVHDGRTTMLRYLRAVRAFLDNDAKGTQPSVPKVVTC
jgi:hypothetical protein